MSLSKNGTYERHLLTKIKSEAVERRDSNHHDESLQVKPSSDVEKETKYSNKKQNKLLIAIVFNLILIVICGYILYRFVNEDVTANEHETDEYDNNNETVEDFGNVTSSLSYPGCGELGTFNGRNDSIAFPWLVNISVDDEFKCFGVLMTPDLILSKAECFYKNHQRIEESQIRVTHATHRNQSTLNVCRYVINDDFNRHTLDNNIAVLKLKEKLTLDSIWPICITSTLINSFRKKQQFILPGWNDKLHSKEYWYKVSTKECLENDTKNEIVERKELCVGHNLYNNKQVLRKDNNQFDMEAVITKMSNKWFLVGFKKQFVFNAHDKKLLIVERIDYYESWLSSLIFV